MVAIGSPPSWTGSSLTLFPLCNPWLQIWGGCAKLQCLVRGHCAELQAHRALDDCIALRAVLQHIADMLGVSMLDVLRPFAMKVGVSASLAQMSAM